METILVCVMAFLAAGLTLFSGFGLGTLLMPVLACFSPIEEAIAITAIVHFLNNLLKLALLGRYADRYVVLKFGLPALPSAFLGAWVLGSLVDQSPLASYHLFNRDFHVMPLKLIIAILLAVFTLIEAGGNYRLISFDKKYLPIGGFMSGFFGGLSGHQGALRSAFLIKSGLTRESFLGSGVMIACLVDLARIAVYGVSFPSLTAKNHVFLLVAVTASGLCWYFFRESIRAKGHDPYDPSNCVDPGTWNCRGIRNRDDLRMSWDVLMYGLNDKGT